MSWFWDDDGYRRNEDGDYYDAEEAQRAADNGYLKTLTNGCFWNPDTGEEFWSDGEKK